MFTVWPQRAGMAAVVLAVGTMFGVGAGAARAAENAAGWRIGIGTSAEADPAKAGEAAAAAARAGYGAGDPNVVLLFAARGQVVPALLEGVAKHFKPATVYGGEVAAPLTPDSNFPLATELDIPAGVGVLALGGDFDLAVAAEKTRANDGGDVDGGDGAFTAYRDSGERLGRVFAEAMASSKRPGQLLFVYGDQYNGSNKAFADGLNAGLGGTYPIVGGAAGNNAANVIVAGKIEKGANFALLFQGDFTVGQTLMGGTHTPETADRAVSAAIAQGGGKEPFFAFFYNCRRRRMGMMQKKQLGEELAMFRKNMGSAPFFGGYGPGEIGRRGPDAKAEGTGFSIVTAVLFPAK